MDIKEYVDQRKFTADIMAKHLGCSTPHFRAVMQKRLRASYCLAKKIQEYTRGKVKVDDIMTWELKKSSKHDI